MPSPDPYIVEPGLARGFWVTDMRLYDRVPMVPITLYKPRADRRPTWFRLEADALAAAKRRNAAAKAKAA